jgi:hypothetical protein
VNVSIAFLVCFQDHVSKIQKKNPALYVKILPDARHYLFLKDPADVAQSVKVFARCVNNELNLSVIAGSGLPLAPELFLFLVNCARQCLFSAAADPAAPFLGIGPRRGRRCVRIE